MSLRRLRSISVVDNPPAVLFAGRLLNLRPTSIFILDLLYLRLLSVRLVGSFALCRLTGTSVLGGHTCAFVLLTDCLFIFQEPILDKCDKVNLHLLPTTRCAQPPESPAMFWIVGKTVLRKVMSDQQ